MTAVLSADLVRPFLISARNAAQGLLQTTLKFGELRQCKGAFRTDSGESLVGVIGISGSLRGKVVLAVPAVVARKLVARMLGSDPEEHDVVDGVGELVNVVAGGAKTMLGETRPGLALTVPNVVVGSSLLVHTAREAPAMLIPCVTPEGEFVVQVGFRAE